MSRLHNVLALLSLLLLAAVPASAVMLRGEKIAAPGFAESGVFFNVADAPPVLMSSGEAAVWGHDLGMQDGPNVYAYVKENPWTAFDPEGLEYQPILTTNGMDSIAYTAKHAIDWAVNIGSKVAQAFSNVDGVRGNQREQQIFGTLSGPEIRTVEDQKRLNQAGDGAVAIVEAMAGGPKGGKTPRSSPGSTAPKIENVQRPPSVPPPGASPTATQNPKAVTIDKSKYPEAAKHLEDAGAVGVPLTVDREGAAARRKAALKGQSTQPNMDRDEAPPAVFEEGSKSVRLIPPSDNRGAGGTLGQQIKDVKNGEKVIIHTTVWRDKPKA